MGLLLALVGCQTISPLAPVDVTQPGWTVQQGQAIWQPRTDQVETLGEVLVATHPSGDSLVEFSKAPFPILSAQRQGDQWQLRFALENRTRLGSGRPPVESLWLYVTIAIQGGPLPEPVRITQPGAHRWLLEQVDTGERLTFVLDPR